MLKEMRHNEADLYKPALFLTAIQEIPQRQDLIDFIYSKIKSGETIRAQGDGTDVGYVMLDNEEMQKVFQPIFDKLGINPKISYVYIHYTARNGQFAVHSHDRPHAVCYLQVPLNCAHIYFPDFDSDDTVAPIENKILVIPEGIPHGISQHHSDTLRIAVTMQLEDLI